MVIKPSELTPLSALGIAKVFDEAGLPNGVLSVAAGMNPAAFAGPIIRTAHTEANASWSASLVL